MTYPKAIQQLINELTRLPSVGPKTAERYVFYLLKKSPEDLQRLAQLIAELKEKTIRCTLCGTISETNPCVICADSKRDQNSLCVISTAQDMMQIEATKQFNGLYHVLGGLLNVIEDVKPENLNIQTLFAKIKTGKITEIILALNPTLEGETTAMYLAKALQTANIKITRLARGLPMGSDIEYMDEMTLANALKYRNNI